MASCSAFPDQSVDMVFSYITLQHVPTVGAQLRYLSEAVRVLRSGGQVAVQVRTCGWQARACHWAGQLAHFVAGRRTLGREWRGALGPATLRAVGLQ
jgi:ubiquinone/menaquinone biosynthesis C-methylase UbiE